MTEILRFAAFTDSPSGGNPAGVVLDASGLSGAQMQQIAADVGYSETAFATQDGPREFRLRYFSPLAEVAFCGHATIAAGVALARRNGPGELRFATAAGEIAVSTTADNGGHSAALRSAPTRSRPASDAETAQALAALGWARQDLDPAFPPHVAFAGNDHLVLAAGTRDRLASLDYDFPALKTLMTDRGWTTVQLFWRESAGVFHSRNPFPVGGVVEDPATGAAAAALGGYLRALGQVSEPATFTILQGEDMGRPSKLAVTVTPDDDRVTVAGTAVPLAAP